jgi:hypothetical protein
MPASGTRTPIVRRSTLVRRKRVRQLAFPAFEHRQLAALDVDLQKVEMLNLKISSSLRVCIGTRSITSPNGLRYANRPNVTGSGSNKLVIPDGVLQTWSVCASPSLTAYGDNARWARS